MTQSLANSVAALVAHARSCTGIKYAPDSPPDNIAVYPFAVVYPERGTIMSEAADQSRNIHIVIVEFHVNRTLLPAAVTTASAYIEEFGDLLVKDPTLAGACEAIPMGQEQNIVYEFGRLEWNKDENIGVRLHVPVKIRKDV